jgi:hypothetical protein
MVRRLMKRFAVSVSVAAVVLSLGATVVFAGEITGNGTLKTVHGNSPCAFSGQEDLQWYTTDGDTTLVADPVKGDPAHSQNWGHTKQATGLTGGANNVPGAEWGCNGHDFGLK